MSNAIVIDRRTAGQLKAILLNVISLAIACYGVFKISQIQLPDHLKDAGHYQFLTNISLLVSMITFILGLAAHVTKSSVLFNIKNVVHTFAFIVEAVVTLVYWPLRLFFLKLLVKNGNVRIGLLTDLSIHLMPFVSLAIDFFYFMPNFAIPAYGVFFSCLALTSAYWVWLETIIDPKKGGSLPYEFLVHDDKRTTLVVFWCIGLSAFVQFLIMRFLYGKFVKDKRKTE